MRLIKAAIGAGIILFACIWCYVAGREESLATAEADLLRAQAAESQERVRLLQMSAAAQAQREQSHVTPGRDERPRPTLPSGLPPNVLQQRPPSPAGPDPWDRPTLRSHSVGHDANRLPNPASGPIPRP